MLHQLKNIAGIIAVTTVGTLSAQQLKVPAPSPSQTIRQSFALSDITIDYSRPSAKGRAIMGDLVPYGKIWRTGANGATKIAFGEDVKVEGIAVPSGTYAVYTVPNKDSWEVMLYKDLALGGNVSEYKKENEVARFVVKTASLHDKFETFTIDVSDMTTTSCGIDMKWENTKVTLHVVAEIDAKIMKNIETAVINDNRPYYQAASYYYESGKDLSKASEWVDKAIATNPKAYWMFMLKAKIQAKQNNKKEAIVTANQVLTLARDAKNDDYVKMAEKFISDNK